METYIGYNKVSDKLKLNILKNYKIYKDGKVILGEFAEIIGIPKQCMRDILMYLNLNANLINQNPQVRRVLKHK